MPSDPINPSAQNSPPLVERCSHDGVVNVPAPQDGVENIPTPQDEVDNIPTLQDQVVHKISINNIPIQFAPVRDLPRNPRLMQRAKDLRKARNLPEVVFWMQVHKGAFHKIDFDRQRVIGNYIVDFYVKKLGLVVEIDGSSHDHKVEYDRIREEYLKALGLRVYRIAVLDVMQNLGAVMMALEAYIVEHYGLKSLDV